MYPTYVGHMIETLVIFFGHTRVYHTYVAHQLKFNILTWYRVRVMVFNATFNNIQLYYGGLLY
jgi:hypothetical protein